MKSKNIFIDKVGKNLNKNNDFNNIKSNTNTNKI
jgi:hypothetical protein